MPFLIGIFTAIVCFIGLNAAMVPVSKSQYCGSKCHEMNSAYTSWELSVHGTNQYGVSVECIDCHLPSKEKYFSHVATKVYLGAKDIYKHNFGDEYDVEKMSKKVSIHMPSRRCLNCHNNLLAKGDNSAARQAHSKILTAPDKPENRCMTCHENAGHERQKKLFSQ